MTNRSKKTGLKSGKGGPVRSEYIRFSDRKSIQLKLWHPSPSKYGEGIMPAYIEIEEITFSKDGEPPKYGSSVRIAAKGEAFMLLSYLDDFLKEARQLTREARQ